MSDDPHPCMKVTSFIRKILADVASATKIQGQNVPTNISDDENNSSILILGAENIAAKILKNNRTIFSDDLRPYPLVRCKTTNRLRMAIGESRLQINRFSLN